MLSSPSSLALLFIFSTNFFIEPALCSARASAASFAELIKTPYRRSSTVICSFTLKNIWDPFVLLAVFEIVTMSWRLFSSKMIVAVMSFVMDAICRLAFPFFSNKTSPVWLSMATDDFASMTGETKVSFLIGIGLAERRLWKSNLCIFKEACSIIWRLWMLSSRFIGKIG